MDKIKIVGIIFVGLIVGCVDPKEQAEDYVKELARYPIQKVSLKKYLIDPSYNYPYNVYIKIVTDSSSLLKLINDLGLVQSFGEDSSRLKRHTPLDEYRFFFSMCSINKERNSSVENVEKSISWWPFNGEETNVNPVYASPYRDSLNQRSVVSFKDRYNGRLALTVDKSNVYILIENWGW